MVFWPRHWLDGRHVPLSLPATRVPREGGYCDDFSPRPSLAITLCESDPCDKGHPSPGLSKLSMIKVKEESEKVGLKINIQKTKIQASGPITTWQIDGDTVETGADFIFGAPKSLWMVTAAMKLKDACSLEG